MSGRAKTFVLLLAMLVGASGGGLPAGASTASVSLRWTLTPGATVSPGQQADKHFDLVDDAPWNSSFVVQVSAGDKPAVGRVVNWKTTDPTGKVQSVATKTDAQGLARAWYFGGLAKTQVVTAIDSESKRSLSFTLTSVNPKEKQGSRYLGTFMESGEDRNWDAMRTVARIDTAPKASYYELAMGFARNGVNGDEGVYGGVQQLECVPGTNELYQFDVCDKARGIYSGRLAIFAAWGTVGSDQKFITPRVISSADGGSCQPFDNEGSGMTCKVAMDWTTGELWAWQVTREAGAPAGWTRLSATISHVDGSDPLTVATFDVPYEMSLATNGQFVEDFKRGSVNCLKTERRSMTVKAIGFLAGSTWHRATSSSTAYGWLNPCFNFQVREDADGLHLDAGGSTGWYNFWPALTWGAGGTNGTPGWSSANRSHDPMQGVSAKTLLTY